MSTPYNHKMKITSPPGDTQRVSIYQKESDTGSVALTWQVYTPYKTNNISWEPSYAVYGSTQKTEEPSRFSVVPVPTIFNWECDHPLLSKPSEKFVSMGMSDYKWSDP